MPLQPTRSDIHVNRPLTNLSIAYIQDESAFIHDKVFPVVPVKKQSDRYFVYTKDYWFRTVAAKRAPASESVGTGYRVDNTPSYFCDVWAVHHDIPNEDYENADEPLDVEADATELVTRNLLLRRERLFVAQYMTTGIWQGYNNGSAIVDFSPNVNGSGYWDSATSNPMQDIDILRRQVEGGTGYVPNTLVLTKNVFYALRNHPAVMDRIKYTQEGIVTADLLAGLFGVERVLVSGAVLNTAQEGQSAVMNFMASNGFLLTYTPSSPGIKKPSAGYIFSWNGRVGAGPFGNTIEKFYMQPKKATRIEGEMAFAFAQTGRDLGVYGTSVLQRP